MNDLPENLKLTFPDWSEKQVPQPLSLPEIIALCEKMLPYWNAERFAKPLPPLIEDPFSLEGIPNNVQK